ncbi:CinA family protein [Paenalcaligenes niemegkensis]|uniref:CinA family protein n=1 Tax=Paenalcaligenes niemegkensis TaxID=2895469 RepID=UPI001EE79E67|nr:CinA family protein [Paenalcaligenes niemegkensis]MCQ9615337.1 CinA family protein [Paenalcaligenes niemegkensis]
MIQSTNLQLAEKLGVLLKSKAMLLATAESCTGGLIAASCTAIDGSSQWFERGFVTYSNAAKQENLNVSFDTLDRFGAVSEETAMEMASGALASAVAANIGISTTGIAGPTGSTPGKPVGMVCFGLAKRTQDGIVTRAYTHIFDGDRSQIREQAVAFIINATAELLEQE